MKQRCIALLLILLFLPLCAPALADEDWPAFIGGEHYPLLGVPQGLYSAVYAAPVMPGMALDGVSEARGLTLRTHWAAFDGVMLLMLFSMEGRADDGLDAAALGFEATHHGSASDYFLARWEDQDAQRVYMLTYAAVVEEAPAPRDPFSLTVRRQDAADWRHPCGLVRDGALAYQPVMRQNIAPQGSSAESLVLHTFEVEDGLLRVDYTLRQRADDPCGAYLVACVGDGEDRLLSEPVLVDGDATLIVSLPEEPVVILLVSDTDEAFATALFPGWTLPIPLEGYDPPPVSVRRIPLDVSIAYASPEDDTQQTEGMTPAQIASFRQIASMLPGSQEAMDLRDMRVTLHEAILYQTGLVIFYTLHAADPDSPASAGDMEEALRAHIFSCSLEPEGGEGSSGPWGSITPNEENGVHTIKGVLRVAYLPASEDAPLAVILSHPQFEGGDVRLELVP